MVLLTMTQPIVDGLHELGQPKTADKSADARHNGEEQAEDDSETSLAAPEVGKPISHGQIIDLWKKLQSTQDSSHSLEKLLQGSRVYIPPAPPKPEPSNEYKALMARLRREEAQRAYERMINPPSRTETFSDLFPTAAQSFSAVNRPKSATDLGDDEVTLNEVHRQVMLIINFLVSIIGVAATLWISARWWSLPARLFLTMGGSIVVAIAEVGVYQGYVWRMSQSKSRLKAVKEVKEVVQTWVVGQDEGKAGGVDNKTVLLRSKEDDADGTVRKRTAATAKPDT